jgi:hypothetical protein
MTTSNLSNPELDAGNSRQVDAEISNTDQRDGEEVGELYLTFPNLPGAPLRALRGFKRIHVARGATQRVAFNLQPRDLSLVNERGDQVFTGGSAKSVSAEDNQEQLQASRLLFSFGASRHCRNSGSLESLTVET